MVALHAIPICRDPAAEAPGLVQLPPEARRVALAAGLRLLTPLQWQCLRAGWFEAQAASRGQLLEAPPGAGAGTAMLLLAAEYLARGKRILWLCRHQGRIDLRMQMLNAALRPEGTRVGPPPAEYPAWHRTAAPDVLLATYEAAGTWLSRHPEQLASIGLLVAENLELLGDARRAPARAALLSHLRAAPYPLRRIGLLGGWQPDAEFRHWWGGNTPADAWAADGELLAPRAGVLAGAGSWRWRECFCVERAGSSGMEQLWDEGDWRGLLVRGEELRMALGGAGDDPALTSLLGITVGLGEKSEKVVLVAPGKQAARDWCAALAEHLAGPAAPRDAELEPIRNLARDEPMADHALVAYGLARGVALLHGELSAGAREIALNAFARGTSRVLVAAPGCLAGRRVSARWLVTLAFRWRLKDQGGYAPAALTRDELHELAGCLAHPAARLVVCAGGTVATRQAWQHLIEADRPVLRVPAWNKQAWLGAVPRMLLNGACRAQWLATEMPGTAGAGPEALEQAVADLTAARCVQQTGDGWLRLTERGRVAARHNLSPATLRALLRIVRDHACLPIPAQPLPAIWQLALCQPTDAWPIAHAPAGSGYLRAYAEALDEVPAQAWPAPVADVLRRRGGPTPRERLALEIGWRLAPWIRGAATPQIEAATRWHAGLLARCGEQLAWLMRALATLIALEHPDAARVRAWRLLAQRLSGGLPEHAAELVELNAPRLGRMGRLALSADGLRNPAEVAAATPEYLARLLRDADLAREVWLAAQPFRRAPIHGPARVMPLPVVQIESAQPARSSKAEPAARRGVPAEPLLTIDMTSPGIVRARGCAVALTPLAWDLLLQLALAPNEVRTRAYLYSALWPEAGPEDQQLDAHRRAIVSALAPSLGKRARELIQVHRGIGFRLTLQPGDVCINR